MPDPFADGVIDDDALRNMAKTRECAQCGEKGEKLRRCKDCGNVWYSNKSEKESGVWPESGLPDLS